MSIKHIEDLPVADFIDVIESFAVMEATEKLDGANLSFGVDNDNKLFVSRESKQSSANRVYDVSAWANIGSSNTFRSAHIALLSVEDQLKTIVKPGQLIEIEVLFGKQPNAITYGNNSRSYIAFLRGLKGTSNEVVSNLINNFQNKTTEVNVPVLSSTDGIKLDNTDRTVIFEFIGPQKINMGDIAASAELVGMVKNLNDFLVADATGLPDGADPLTNGDLASINLTNVKQEIREDVKYLREKMNAHIRRVFMQPIKQFLIEKLVHVKSSLASPELDPSEDIGIEGVVLRDPKSGDLFKIVDRNRFTALNAFNHVTRRVIGGTVKTTDGEAAIESRGGIMGHMGIQIATLIGEPEMARASQMRKIMGGYNTDGNPVNTIKAFAADHEPVDFQGFKRKIIAIAKQANTDLQTLLANYNRDKGEYKLQFSNGQSIGITEEINNRTNLAFAEAFRDIAELVKYTTASNKFVIFAANLYRRAIHGAEPDMETADQISESLIQLFERRYDTDPKRYANKDAWHLLNIYFATVFMSALIYKTGDKIGLRMLKDKTHFRMERWTKEMSPLNFWGYPIWRSNNPAVKKLIGSKASKELYKVVKRVPPAWFKFLHMDLSFGNDIPINWVDHYKTLKVLQQFNGMNVERVNILLRGIFSYENLTYDQRIKVLNQLYYYINQFIPYSPLFIRVKSIYSDLLNHKQQGDSMLISDIVESTDIPRNIRETADGGTVTSADGNTFQKSIFGSSKANVVKRKRNNDIKFLKFVKPDNCPIN